MALKSKGKHKASKDDDDDDVDHYDNVFQSPPNSLDFSNFHRSQSQFLASSPEPLIIIDEDEVRSTPAGLSGNLAFGNQSPPAVRSYDMPLLTKSTKSNSQESLPRSPEYDPRALTALLDCHHNSLITSLRSVLEITMGHMQSRLDELVSEVVGLRREVGRMRSRQASGDQELLKRLEQEKSFRIRRDKEHEAEMDNLYRQLANAL